MITIHCCQRRTLKSTPDRAAPKASPKSSSAKGPGKKPGRGSKPKSPKEPAGGSNPKPKKRKHVAPTEWSLFVKVEIAWFSWPKWDEVINHLSELLTSMFYGEISNGQACLNSSLAQVGASNPDWGDIQIEIQKVYCVNFVHIFFSMEWISAYIDACIVIKHIS